jgi:MFS family permease
MLLFQALLMTGPQGAPLLALLWFGFAFSGSCGPASYSLVAQRFAPELVGRVATAMNFSMLALVFLLQNAIGWVLDFWPRTAAGGWDPAGYSWALGFTLAAEGLTIAWLLLAPMLEPGRPRRERRGP